MGLGETRKHAERHWARVFTLWVLGKMTWTRTAMAGSRWLSKGKPGGIWEISSRTYMANEKKVVFSNQNLKYFFHNLQLIVFRSLTRTGRTPVAQQYNNFRLIKPF